MRIKNVSISLDEKHLDFIGDQSRSFCLSKFVKNKLDIYIERINEKNKLIKKEETQ